jgi:hypothetical protein
MKVGVLTARLQAFKKPLHGVPPESLVLRIAIHSYGGINFFVDSTS